MPQRHNIVVTRIRGYVAEGCTLVDSIERALSAAGNVPEIAVIGGAQIFEELLPRADILYITYVHAHIDGDTFFPPLSPDEWHEHERRELDVGPTNAYHLSFVTLVRPLSHAPPPPPRPIPAVPRPPADGTIRPAAHC